MSNEVIYIRGDRQAVRRVKQWLQLRRRDWNMRSESEAALAVLTRAKEATEDQRGAVEPPDVTVTGSVDQGLLGLDLSRLFATVHAVEAVELVGEAKKRLGWVSEWRRTGRWDPEAQAELERLEAVRVAEREAYWSEQERLHPGWKWQAGVPSAPEAPGGVEEPRA